MEITNDAQSHVLAIPELLENILSQLPMRDILFAQRVSRHFKELIDTSTLVQQKLFLLPTPGPARAKPSADELVCEYLRSKGCGILYSLSRSLARDGTWYCTVNFTINDSSKLDTKGSWEKMLLYQPDFPCTCLGITSTISACPEVWPLCFHLEKWKEPLRFHHAIRAAIQEEQEHAHLRHEYRRQNPYFTHFPPSEDTEPDYVDVRWFDGEWTAHEPTEKLTYEVFAEDAKSLPIVRNYYRHSRGFDDPVYGTRTYTRVKGINC